MGISPYRYKVLAFTVASLFGGVSGFLYMVAVQYTSPETLSFGHSISLLARWSSAVRAASSDRSSAVRTTSRAAGDKRDRPEPHHDHPGRRPPRRAVRPAGRPGQPAPPDPPADAAHIVGRPRTDRRRRPPPSDSRPRRECTERHREARTSMNMRRRARGVDRRRRHDLRRRARARGVLRGGEPAGEGMRRAELPRRAPASPTRASRSASRAR